MRTHYLLGVKYHKCAKEELVTFAESRGLLVNSTAARPHDGPTRADYLKALRQADDEYVFQFLDLIPELRTRIYKELLILREAYKCFPQIHRTCKQVNQEATNVLYGDNLLEVRVHPYHVLVHGASVWPSLLDISYLHWPEFLRRAQWLKCSVLTPGLYDQQYNNSGSRRQLSHATLNILLYSLCSFLKGNHKLRSIELDGTQLSAQDVGHCNAAITKRVLEPLQLLGKLKQIIVRTTNGVTELENDVFPATRSLTGGVLEEAMLVHFEASLYDLYYAPAEHAVALGYLSDSEGENLLRLQKRTRKLAAQYFSAEVFIDNSWEHNLSREVHKLTARLETVQSESIRTLMGDGVRQLLLDTKARRDARKYVNSIGGEDA